MAKPFDFGVYWANDFQAHGWNCFEGAPPLSIVNQLAKQPTNQYSLLIPVNHWCELLIPVNHWYELLIEKNAIQLSLETTWEPRNPYFRRRSTYLLDTSNPSAASTGVSGRSTWRLPRKSRWPSCMLEESLDVEAKFQLNVWKQRGWKTYRPFPDTNSQGPKPLKIDVWKTIFSFFWGGAHIFRGELAVSCMVELTRFFS